MKINEWLTKNTASLKNKTVAVTGTTGGLGRELCRYLARLGASIVLMDRNAERSNAFRSELEAEFGVSVSCINIDLEDIGSVKRATSSLLELPVDVFIHNAGAYDIPRHKTSIGYDNVFQINFISPYYIIRTLMPSLRERGGRAVIVSSIAHNYSKIDVEDIDFSTRKASSKVYGNAKRYLTFSLYELFRGESEASLAVTHPGISLTGITAHYPKLIFAIIKYPMKVIFMSPEKACLSILRGVFEKTEYCRWIGPRFLDVWGFPKNKKLDTCKAREREQIFEIAERIYKEISRGGEENG